MSQCSVLERCAVIMLTFSYTEHSSLLFLFRTSSMGKQRIIFFSSGYSPQHRKEENSGSFRVTFFQIQGQNTPLTVVTYCSSTRKLSWKVQRVTGDLSKPLGSEEVSQLNFVLENTQYLIFPLLSWEVSALNFWQIRSFIQASCCELRSLNLVLTATVNFDLGGLKYTRVTEIKSTILKGHCQYCLFFLVLFSLPAHMYFCL